MATATGPSPLTAGLTPQRTSGGNCGRARRSAVGGHGDCCGSFCGSFGASRCSGPADRAALSPEPVAGVVDDRVEVATAAYRKLLEVLGPDEANRSEVAKTPLRAAKAWLELTAGIGVSPRDIVGNSVFDVEGVQDVVVVRDMPFNSLCEHHLLPFSGVVHVAYVPNQRVLGLSKFARLLRVFTKRLQLQERISAQFADCLVELVGPQAVAVVVEGRHSCMSMRGVETPAVTRTIAVRGAMKDDPHMRELLLQGVWTQGASRL